MPGKMFQCTICGNQVSKRKSLAVDDKGGRACKHHEEAQKVKNEKEKKRRDQLIRARKKERRWKEDRSAAVASKRSIYHQNSDGVLVSNCFFCGRKGIKIHDFMYRLMFTESEITSSIVEGLLKKNVRTEIRERLTLDTLSSDVPSWIPACLILREWNNEVVVDKMVRDSSIRGASRLSGAMLICTKCYSKVEEYVKNKLTSGTEELGPINTMIDLLDKDLAEATNDDGC